MDDGSWGLVALCEHYVSSSDCQTMRAAAAVSVLAFVFTLMGCLTTFTRYWERYQRSWMARLAFTSGSFWALLSLILYPAADMFADPFQDNVAWPSEFLALLLLVLLSAKFRALSRRSKRAEKRAEKRAKDIADGRLIQRGTARPMPRVATLRQPSRCDHLRACRGRTPPRPRLHLGQSERSNRFKRRAQAGLDSP
jgi:hypothetical protein